jgi:hypothetical protein
MLKKYVVGIFLAISVLAIFQAGITFAGECSVRDIYDLNLVIYKNGSAIITGPVTAGKGIISEFSPNPKYSIRIIDGNGKEIFKEGLLVSFYRPMPFNGECDNVTLHVRVPSLPNAKYLVVTLNQTDLLKVDLSSEFCNSDGICTIGENGYNCNDCVKEEGSPLQPPIKLNSDWIPIVLLFAILAIMAIFMKMARQRALEDKKKAAAKAASFKNLPKGKNKPSKK